MAPTFAAVDVLHSMHVGVYVVFLFAYRDKLVQMH